jgi:cytochrome c-type biogenesis protein CcmE
MNAKSLIGLVVGVVCLVTCLVALTESTSRRQSFDQIAKSTDRVKVYGKLDRSSIRAIQGSTKVRFDLIEEKTEARLAVFYDNPSAGLPLNFPAASHAMASGQFDPSSGMLHSNAVQTKCPSKYDEGDKLDKSTELAVQKWQAQTAATGS